MNASAPGGSEAVHAVLPPDRRIMAEAVIAVRLAELAEDLRLPRIPPLSTEPGEEVAVRIGGDAIRIPRGPRKPRRGPGESAAALGERVASGLIRARLHLMQPAMRREGLLPGPARREAVALGANLDDLRAMAAGADDPGAADWGAAERLPRDVTLLTSDPAAWTDTEELSQVASIFAGFDLPNPSARHDPGLAPGLVRFRFRGLRGPAARLDPAELVPAALAYARQSAALMDAITVTELLLRADPGSRPSLPELLREAPAPALAAALRPLLAAGFGLPDMPALVRAVLGMAAPAADPAARSLVLPGYIAVGGDGRLDAAGLGNRLRAASVPSALLRRVGGSGQTVSIWKVPARLAAQLVEAPPRGRRLDRLAEAAQPASGGQMLALLVPGGYGWTLWRMLADDLPDLLVVEETEFPASLQARQRDVIAPEEV